jgi:ABC-type antimicrobial peptide transport system permease subunit
MRWDEISRLAGLVMAGPLPNEHSVPVMLDSEPDLDITAVGMSAIPAEGFDGSGVIISGNLAANASIDEGDTISMTIAGNLVEREVLAVVTNELLQFNLALRPPPENLILFEFNDLVSITGEVAGGNPVPNAYYITMNADSPTTEDADEVIEIIQESLLEQGINARYINQLKQSDLATEQTVNNTSIFLVAALLIAVVGAIGLLTTLSISVFERQKEIGVMRSIGAGSGVIALQFLIEGLIVGLIAWLVGLPISYGVAIAFNAVANLEHVTFTYPRIVPLIGLVGMLVVAGLASLGPSLSAARKTVSEILRYQ